MKLDFPDGSKDRLEHLRQMIGAPTHVQVIAEALRVFEHVVQEVVAGRTVVLERKDLFDDEAATKISAEL